jgi:hypothetical protein
MNTALLTDVKQDLRLSISDAIFAHFTFLQRSYFSEVVEKA